MFPSVLALLALFPIFGLIVGMFWLEARLFPPARNADTQPDTDTATRARPDLAPWRSRHPREHTKQRTHPRVALFVRRGSVRRPRLRRPRRASTRPTSVP